MAASKTKVLAPTGIALIDRLDTLDPCTIHDYVSAVSAYVKQQGQLAAGPKKASQIRLSGALARALAHDLESHLPSLKGKLVTHEQKVAGGLRTVNADVSESHQLDGLRIAVELKPINLAVGRALWNRFGDIRTFAVNIHLKFPFAVVGGVLVIPTYEEVGSKAALTADALEEIAELGETPDPQLVQSSATSAVSSSGKRSTVHLIQRAIERLVRAGGRKSEADASHLLEGIAVVVYDPDTGQLDANMPDATSRLRWDNFVEDLATSYQARFE